MAFLKKIPRWLLVLVLLALFGLVRTPIESKLRQDFVEANLLLPPPGHSAMQQMSQATLMGTLGGLRSLAAVWIGLEAFDDFSLKQWDELKRKYTIITNLEPRDENHWVLVVWHLGINATANMEIDESIPKLERQRRFFEYANTAIKLAEDGLKQNPDSAAIRLQLAEVYREKLKDPCETARVYKEAMYLEGALPYVERFHGYYLAQCPGKEKEAYDFLLELFHRSPRHRKEGLTNRIEELEEKLNIPESERLEFEQPVRPGMRRRK